MKAISIQGLNKTYIAPVGDVQVRNILKRRKTKEVQALRDVNIDVEASEICALVGPNGAGKSTLIKIMCGIMHPTSGSVLIAGLSPQRQRKLLVHKIGVVFAQKTLLQPDLPAKMSFELYRRMYGIDQSKYVKRLELFLPLLRNESVIETPVRNLSLGERMKCEFVASLLHNPDVVLLDEPTIGLDVVSRNHILDFIKEYNRITHCTFLITSHDINFLEKIADRFMLLKNGAIDLDDDKEELSTEYDSIKLKITQYDIEAVCRYLDERDVAYDLHAEWVEMKLGVVEKMDILRDIMTSYEVVDALCSRMSIERALLQRM